MDTTHKPHVYQIRVRGQIPDCWIEVFDNLLIENEVDCCGSVTRLSGVFDDGSALQGVLNNLYMLGLMLISVESKDECRDREREPET